MVEISHLCIYSPQPQYNSFKTAKLWDPEMVSHSGGREGGGNKDKNRDVDSIVANSV